jgi:hypothetical protein
MATISRLVVEISAKTQNLQKGVKSALASLGNIAKQAAKVGGIIGTLIGVAAVGAFAKLTNAIFDTAAALDSTIKTADNLGIIVGDLQRLQFQAEQSGISSAELTVSLRNFTRVLGDASRGSKRAQQAFKDIGVNLKEIQGLSADQAFIKVGRALASVEDRTKQASVASTLFSRNWLSVLNLVRSDLETTGAQFDKLGIRITTEQGKAVEAFNDAQNRLSLLWQGFFNQLTVQSVPAFEKLINGVERFIEAQGGLGPIAAKAAQGVVSAVNFIISALSGVLDVIDAIIVGFKRIELGINRLRQFNALTNPLAIALNATDEGGVQSFENVGRLQQEIADVQNRAARRQQQVESVQREIQRTTVDITVSANKDAIVEQIKIDGDVRKQIDTQVKSLMNEQARANDR